jgi:hypothetical protein
LENVLTGDENFGLQYDPEKPRALETGKSTKVKPMRKYFVFIINALKFWNLYRSISVEKDPDLCPNM